MRWTSRGVSAVVLAVLVTVLTSMPVFLLGALATEITGTIHVPAFAIGLAVGSYWVAAALTSASTGALGHLLSEKRMGLTAVLLAVLSLIGSAIWVPSWPWLILWAVLGGAGNGLGHPSSNHLLVTRIPAPSRGLAFGVKQAAVPAAGLLAGASIPLVALTFGWPAAFIMMAILGTAVLIPTALIRTAPPARDGARAAGKLEVPLRPSLLLMATMTMFAAGAANSTLAFCVIGAVERGIDVGPAGVLLAVGSAAGAVVRIVVGRVVDRGRVSALVLIRSAIVACGVGLAFMAIPTTWSYLVGFLLVAGLGWGWPGLVHFLVSKVASGAAASATGIVQTGSYVGSAVGPVLTGVVFSLGNSSLAWAVLAVMAATAVIISFRVGHRLRSLDVAEAALTSGNQAPPVTSPSNNPARQVPQGQPPTSTNH